MATQKEIRVGSIVYSGTTSTSRTGIVLHLARPRSPRTADIYWFKYKRTDWEYIDYLEVLVY